METEKTDRLVKSVRRGPFRTGVHAFLTGKTWQGIVRHKMLYLLLLPAIVLICIFCYAPMFGVIIVFQD